MVKKILLLGNQELYEESAPVEKGEDMSGLIRDLHDTLFAFREKYHVGRAIASPQIGVKKRVIYMYLQKPTVFINPTLTFPNEKQMMEVLDDCMSFPNLLVKVKRHRYCDVTYFDENWTKQTVSFADDLSELIQHEYDHLDGILAAMRAIDGRSFFLKQEK